MNCRNASAFSIFVTSIVLGALVQGTNANAQDGYYGEIGWSPLDVKNEADNVSHPKAMRLLIGKEFHENLAVEALYMATYNNDSQTGFEAKATHFGLLLKPKYAITTDTQAFARIGVTYSNFTASSVGDRKGSELAYGIGLQTSFSKSVYGQIDYMNYYEKDGQSSKGYTVSIGTRF